MRRKIPSTAALAAFESAARHQSFTRAADELAVTQSAICRQIAGLEEFLGLKLFRRSRRGVILTEAGQRYSETVRARLDDVERDTLELMATGGRGGSLELAVVPTFATQWLIPRLGRFQQQHPGITLHLSARTRPFVFEDTTLDAAIVAGDAGWPGTEAVFLMRETLIAVGSPALLQGRKALAPEDLRHLTLLQASTRPHAWRQWFASLGMQADNDMAGPRMELFSMLTAAAAQGLGVALVPRLLVEAELASGTLAQVVPHEVPSDRSYHLIYPEQKIENTSLAEFRQWISLEARGSE